MSKKKILIRNALIFQLKLGLDAIRDILLSPIALFALLMDLISDTTSTTESYFYRLMSWGRFSDQWIGLFEIDSKSTPETPEKQNVDTLIAQIESSFKEKTLTVAGKKKLHHYLHSLLNNKSAPLDMDKDL